MAKIYKLIILGAGASGLMTAISASKQIGGKDICIVDRNDKIGKKLSVTGNGQGNLGNLNLDFAKFHTNTKDFFKFALNNFDTQRTIEFFESLGGVVVSEQNGKLFLSSYQATSITDLFRLELAKKKIDLKLSFLIKSVKKSRYFEVVSKDGEVLIGENLVVSLGGMASPSFGSDGSGYKILESFSHTCTRVCDGLVQLKTPLEFVRQLKGIKCDVRVSVFEKTKPGNDIMTRGGELLFCDYGVSGNVIFELSSYALKAKNAMLDIDLLPNLSHEKLAQVLKKKSKENEDLIFEDLFVGIINKQIGKAIIKKCGLSLNLKCAANIKYIEEIVNEIKSLKLEVVGSLGSKFAQITCGGVTASEFDDKTLMSLKVHNLYATGEILDIDGDCGGYNLQWAWASGFLVGQCICKQL